MYNLAQRFPKYNPSGTPEHISPDTYTVCFTSCGRRKNRAPFLSCEGRKFSIARPVYTDALYSIDTCKRIIGGASINYTAERKTIVKTRDPGPGDYEPKINVCRAVREIKGKGRVYMCRVPYSHEISAPSIPTYINENGYNVYNGRLVRIPPDDHDETIGPAFYCVPTGEVSCTTRRYKGWRWSCRSAKRGNKFDSNTPGPGAYCVEIPKCRKYEEDEDFRALARHLSYVPRFADAQALNACKEDTPGPAEYDVSTQWVKIEPRAKSIEPRPFITGAERLKSKKEDGTPAPCQYNVTNDVYKKKQFSTICAPFVVKDKRWQTTQADSGPGPGYYEVKGFVDQNLDKIFNRYSLVEVGFNVKAERDTLNIGDAICLPGPGYYDIKKEKFDEAECTASVFKSKTERFKDECSEVDVGPAKYDITKIYKKMRDRKSHHTGDVPFLSSAKRLPGYDQDSPGVGEYILPDLRPNARSISSVARPDCIKGDDIPPPGSYEVNTLQYSSIAKAFVTHNIRLKEQILRKKLRKAPKETRNQYYRTLKKRKILDVFKYKFVEPEEDEFKDLDIIS